MNKGFIKLVEILKNAVGVSKIIKLKEEYIILWFRV
jgi:hypothetical protein